MDKWAEAEAGIQAEGHGWKAAQSCPLLPLRTHAVFVTITLITLRGDVIIKPQSTNNRELCASGLLAPQSLGTHYGNLQSDNGISANIMVYIHIHIFSSDKNFYSNADETGRRLDMGKLL